MTIASTPDCDVASIAGPFCATPQFSFVLHGFWMRLEQPDIGEAIFLLREHFNLTRPDLVQRMWDAADTHAVGVDESLIYRWEKGEKGRPRPRPGTHYRRILALVCERLLADIAAPARADFLHRLSSLTNSPLLPRPTVVGDREPPEPHRIDDMAALIHHYVRMHGTMSPSALQLATARQLDDLTVLVLRSNSPSIAERVRSLAAQTAILAGWLSFENDDRPQALRYWSLAGEFARDAGDRGLRALALGSRSRIYWSTHGRRDEMDITTAIALIDQAERLVDDTDTPSLRSWLSVRRSTLLGHQPGDHSDAEWDEVLDDLIGRP